MLRINPLHSLARFFQFLPDQTWRALWPISFLALGVLTCDILMPWFLKDILTAFSVSSTLELRHFIPVLAIGVIRIVLAALHARQNAFFLSSSLSALNKKMAWSCISKKSHPLSASASELSSLYTESILTIEQFLDSVLWQTFTQGIYCFGATLIVIYLGGPLVLWAFLPFIIGISLSYLMKEKITESISELFSKKGEMGELCQDLLEGRNILHSYQAESGAISLFNALEKGALPRRKQAYVLLGLYPPIFEAIGLMALIVVFTIGYGVWHKYPGSAAGAASVLYLAFLAKTLISVSPLIPLWSRFKVAVDKLDEIFGSTSSAPTERPKPLPGSLITVSEGKETNGIKIDRLKFGYTPEKMVFDNLSVEFPERKLTAIVGPNGSGKSTLMRLLTEEIHLQGGTIAFGSNNNTLDKIAYLPQEPFLFRMSILQNLQLTSPEISSNEIWELAEELGLHTFLKTRVEGLDSPVGARGGALSGGERQKISLLRFALRAKKAQFCLLDEPTSYIDIQSEAALMKVVLKLCAGKTTIVASHRSWLIEQCDQVVTLGEVGE